MYTCAYRRLVVPRFVITMDMHDPRFFSSRSDTYPNGRRCYVRRFLPTRLEGLARYLAHCFPNIHRQPLSKSLHVPMTPPDSLQQLCNLDRASPQFHKQISEFLRGKDYRNAIPNLQGEDLMWFVEYLGSVSFQAIFPSFCTQHQIGYRRRLQSCRSRVAGTLT